MRDRLDALIGRVLDRIFILTCWALAIFMAAVLAAWALSAVI